MYELAGKLMDQQERPAVEVFSAYDLFHDSQAVWEDKFFGFVEYPCTYGKFSKASICDLASHLVEDLNAIRGLNVDEAYARMRSGFIFGEAAAELRVFMDGTRQHVNTDPTAYKGCGWKDNDTSNAGDQPYDKGLFNMSLLWYLASEPFGDDCSKKGLLERLSKNTDMHLNPEIKIENPAVGSSESPITILYNGLNGYDNYRSSVGMVNHTTTPFGKYGVIFTEVRRTGPEGEYNIAMFKETEDEAHVFLETITGSRLMAFKRLIEYKPDFLDLSGQYFDAEFSLMDVAPSKMMPDFRRV